jgi:hypothetical protein
MNEPFSIEYSSTPYAASNRFADSNEQELIAVLRSFRDLIDTILWRVCDDRPETPESSSSQEESVQQQSVVAESRDGAEASHSPQSEPEACSEQTSLPPALQNPDEFLRAVEFLVRRSAHEWQAELAAPSGPVAESLPASEEPASPTFA